jgi:hypothetical protein
MTFSWLNLQGIQKGGRTASEKFTLRHYFVKTLSDAWRLDLSKALEKPLPALA